MGEIERSPETDAASLRAVYDAAQAGRYAEAAALAAAALARGLEHPLLYNVAALEREQQGRLADALGMLQRAVQIAPNDIGSRNALGLCLLRVERPAEALAHFKAVLALDPRLPYAYVSCGNALWALGELSAAEAHFLRALDLDANQNIALTRLAQIAANRGAYPEARGWAEKALELAPGFPDAVLALAAAELGERRVAEAETRVRGLLMDPRLAPTDRAYANGLLGDVLDAQNRADEAFAAYTACNQELRRLNAGRFGGTGSALEYARAMERHFERVQPESWKRPPAAGVHRSGARGLVFVLGFPRSGTTLLEVILEGHPDVVSLEEKESFIDSVHDFMQQPKDLDRLASASAQTLEVYRDAYWQRVAAHGIDIAGKVFVDKYPLNSLKLPLIARLFPDAKILFACRDPRDTVLSCVRHRFKMSAPIFELLTVEGAARYYDAVMRLAVRLTSMLPLDVCLIRHEDLVTEFAREMKRVCSFLNLQWAPAMGDFALRTKARSVLTPSTAQLVRGLNTEGLGQWHRYRQYLEPVLPTLEPWIKRFYYAG